MVKGTKKSSNHDNILNELNLDALEELEKKEANIGKNTKSEPISFIKKDVFANTKKNNKIDEEKTIESPQNEYFTNIKETIKDLVADNEIIDNTNNDNESQIENKTNENEVNEFESQQESFESISNDFVSKNIADDEMTANDFVAEENKEETYNIENRIDETNDNNLSSNKINDEFAVNIDEIQDNGISFDENIDMGSDFYDESDNFFIENSSENNNSNIENNETNVIESNNIEETTEQNESVKEITQETQNTDYSEYAEIRKKSLFQKHNKNDSLFIKNKEENNDYIGNENANGFKQINQKSMFLKQEEDSEQNNLQTSGNDSEASMFDLSNISSNDETTMQDMVDESAAFNLGNIIESNPTTSNLIDLESKVEKTEQNFVKSKLTEIESKSITNEDKANRIKKIMIGIGGAFGLMILIVLGSMVVEMMTGGKDNGTSEGTQMHASADENKNDKTDENNQNNENKTDSSAKTISQDEIKDKIESYKKEVKKLKDEVGDTNSEKKRELNKVQAQIFLLISDMEQNPNLETTIIQEKLKKIDDDLAKFR